MGEFSVWHILIVVAVFVLIFGYKKLPDATRALGRSLRIFKAEVRQLHDDDSAKEAAKEAVKEPAQPRAVEAPAAASQPTVEPARAASVRSAGSDTPAS